MLPRRRLQVRWHQFVRTLRSSQPPVFRRFLTLSLVANHHLRPCHQIGGRGASTQGNQMPRWSGARSNAHTRMETSSCPACCRRIDQIWKDNNNTPVADLWRNATQPNHRGAMLWPSPTMQWWRQWRRWLDQNWHSVLVSWSFSIIGHHCAIVNFTWKITVVMSRNVMPSTRTYDILLMWLSWLTVLCHEFLSEKVIVSWYHYPHLSLMFIFLIISFPNNFQNYTASHNKPLWLEQSRRWRTTRYMAAHVPEKWSYLGTLLLPASTDKSAADL